MLARSIPYPESVSWVYNYVGDIAQWEGFQRVSGQKAITRPTLIGQSTFYDLAIVILLTARATLSLLSST